MVYSLIQVLEYLRTTFLYRVGSRGFIEVGSNAHIITAIKHKTTIHISITREPHTHIQYKQQQNQPSCMLVESAVKSQSACGF